MSLILFCVGSFFLGIIGGTVAGFFAHIKMKLEFHDQLPFPGEQYLLPSGQPVLVLGLKEDGSVTYRCVGEDSPGARVKDCYTINAWMAKKLRLHAEVVARKELASATPSMLPSPEMRALVQEATRHVSKEPNLFSRIEE